MVCISQFSVHIGKLTLIFRIPVGGFINQFYIGE